MKTLSILFILFCALSSNAQTVYEEKMANALTVFSQVESNEDYKNAAAHFDLIANGISTEWLPNYYYSLCYIMMSFDATNESIANRDRYLTIAEERLELLLEDYPKEAEIHVLQGLFYTATLVIDPSTRGQKYSGLTRVALERAIAIEPENPRAKQMLLSNKVGTAQFFGQDLTPFCNEAQQQLNEWDNYIAKSPFHPIWGKNQLYQVLKNCENNADQRAENSTAASLSLTLNFTNIKSIKGNLMIELIDESGSQIATAMGIVAATNCKVILRDLTPGTYAIRYYHDANINQKMDCNKHGIPQESYGFSNNARGFMGEPKFKKMCFELIENKTMTLKVK